MARNAEKAKSMWNKWWRQKEEYEREEDSRPSRRPFIASECNNLMEAERWRKQVVSEIAMKINEIQNASLGEHRIRDLNELINKLLREKGHWNRQIKQLGGPDYSLTESKIYDAEGLELQGYKYFGAARELPSVRQLFAEAHAEKILKEERKKRKRFDSYKNINADYYGFRDEEDNIILEMEKHKEDLLIEKAVTQFQIEKKKRLKLKHEPNPSIISEKQKGKKVINMGSVNSAWVDEDIIVTDDEMIGTEMGEVLEKSIQERNSEQKATFEGETEEDEENGKETEKKEELMRSHVPNLPSQEEMRKAIIEKKKAALLAKLN